MGESVEQLREVIRTSGPSNGDSATGPSLGVVDLGEGEEVAPEKGTKAEAVELEETGLD